ncbi:MAG TPA: isoprenylcysteine carboxyl methyltransferase [Alphaproteobacteria bacterium]|nr:isoprenylcysteine carboxyl methyltransferase [Alphaproteobacteria bacterium]
MSSVKKSDNSTATELKLPKSSTNFFVNIFSCVIFFVLIRYFHVVSSGIQPVELYITIVLTVLPQIIFDLTVGREVIHKNYAVSVKPLRDFNPKRVIIKLVGLYATFGFLYFLYWLLPVYKEPFFEVYWFHLRNLMPVIMLAAIPYVAYVDCGMQKPEDSYYHFGRLFLFDFKNTNRRYIIEHIKSWIIKGFFLPLMFGYMLNNINYYNNYNTDKIEDFHAFFDYANNFIFTIDLLFAVIGYVFTLKIFNSQIYSTEPTALGWIVCLIGYQPFWGSLFYGKYFNYDDGYYWGHMLDGDVFWYTIWGSLILALELLYSLATVAFGYRFSNLTYRGIITCGPYALCKHPAYVFKNVSWWLISVPFMPNLGWENALKCSILLLLVNAIYYIRARTEENHLSNYPEYVQYAEYMNEKSIFAWVGRLIPAMRYSKERALASTSGKFCKEFTQRLD